MARIASFERLARGEAFMLAAAGQTEDEAAPAHANAAVSRADRDRSRGRPRWLIGGRQRPCIGVLPVTSELSRRSLFTTLPGWLGLAGCSASGPRSAGHLVLRSGPACGVDFNSTAEQCLVIVHDAGARPAARQVVLVDVIQDDAAVDTSAVRWAPGYPIYQEDASSDRVVCVAVRFMVPAGVPATGRARILFEL